MAGDLDVGFERSAGVGEKFFVFLGAIRIEDLAADLSVPTVFLAGSGVEVDRVAIFTGGWFVSS